MAALLRACLVTGYGHGDDFKAPAGWEEPFAASGNCACFRALGGARQFYQIDDSQGDADVTRIYACESMPDVMTPVGTWGNYYFGKWYNAEYASGWLVVADERTAYAFIRGRYWNWVPHGFGEYLSLVADNPYNSFVVGHGNAGTMDYAPASPFIISRAIGFNSATSGSVHKSLGGVASSFSVLSTGQAPNTAIGYRYTATYSFTSVDANTGWFVVPLFIQAASDNASTGGRVCGAIRGIYQPLVALPEGDVTINGRPFINLHTDGNNNQFGQLLIDITSWE